MHIWAKLWPLSRQYGQSMDAMDAVVSHRGGGAAPRNQRTVAYIATLQVVT